MPDKADTRLCRPTKGITESSTQVQDPLWSLGPIQENCEAVSEEGVVKDILSSYLIEDGESARGDANEPVDNARICKKTSRRMKEKEIARRIFRSFLDWKDEQKITQFLIQSKEIWA